jgi:hypothetical protein
MNKKLIEHLIKFLIPECFPNFKSIINYRTGYITVVFEA